MVIIEEHRSPDGLFRLIIGRDETGDIAIGLDGYSWHTHAENLASLSGLPEDKAVREFVDHIINDEAILVVSRVGGEICDAWPTEDPEREFKYKPAQESIQLRRWSGAPVEVS